MISVALPGHVLQAALRASRAGLPTAERRSYLQLDDGVEVDEVASRLYGA